MGPPGIWGGMVGPADPIAEFEQAFDKRIRFFLATLVVGFLVPLGFLSYLFLAVPGTFGAWFFVYVTAELVATAVFIRWFRTRLERAKNLPRAMRHRLAPSGVGKSPTVVFDNGLVMTSGFQFRLFGSPMGGTMIPTSEEVPRLVRGMVRMRSVLRVFRNHGPEPLRARLDSIQQALKARFSNLIVALPRPLSPSDPQRPSWVSTAAFSTSPLDSERILAQIDPLASLLEDAAAMGRDLGARTPAALRPRSG